MEHYADILELKVWTSSSVTLSQEPGSEKWRATIIRRKKGPNGQTSEQERTFIVNHVIFCTGMGSQDPPIPSLSGRDTFKGQILHSAQYKRALDYRGKKVVIIGAGTSGTSSILTLSIFTHESAIQLAIFLWIAVSRVWVCVAQFYGRGPASHTPSTDVTIYQRSSTYVLSIDSVYEIMMKGQCS